MLETYLLSVVALSYKRAQSVCRAHSAWPRAYSKSTSVLSSPRSESTDNNSASSASSDHTVSARVLYTVSHVIWRPRIYCPDAPSEKARLRIPDQKASKHSMEPEVYPGGYTYKRSVKRRAACSWAYYLRSVNEV